MMTSCFSAAKKIQYPELCPIKTEYRFFSIHEDLNKCNYELQNDNCKTTFSDRKNYTSGYNTIEFFAYQFPRLDQEQIISSKALIIQFLKEENNLDFSKFVNLEYLQLEQLKGEIPKEIFRLKKLKFLYISGGDILEIPDEIIKLKNLVIFSICSGDDIKKLTPKIFELENLEELTINRLYSIRELEVDFSKLKKLKKLDLWDSDIELNKTLLSCNQLRYLQTNKFHDWFTELPNLKILGLEKIGSELELSKLKFMNRLEEFSINRYPLPYISKSISEIPNLRLLELSFSWSDSSSKINQVKCNFPKLEYLGIYNNKLDELPKFKMPNLRYLNIVDTENKNNIQSAKGLKKYKNLRYLRLTIGENDTGLDLKDDPDTKIQMVIAGKDFPLD